MQLIKTCNFLSRTQEPLGLQYVNSIYEFLKQFGLGMQIIFQNDVDNFGKAEKAIKQIAGEQLPTPKVS